MRWSELIGFASDLGGLHDLVAEWIHFTLFGIILPTIKLKVCTFWGLTNSATKMTFAN